MEDDNKISKLYDLIAERICDDYCKYPEQYDETEALLEERCNDCPLNYL